VALHLYLQLMERGSLAVAAYQTGAFIEDLDIHDPHRKRIRQ
jgi:hypothetical protein